MEINNNLIIDAYIEMAMDRLHSGWDPFLMSFMFNPIPGSVAAKSAQMDRAVEHVYAKMLTRLVRDPRSESGRQNCPFWIVCPDRPVPKLAKTKLKDVAVNDGLHRHALAFVSPRTRLKERFDLEMVANRELFEGPDRALARLDIAWITETPEKAARYVLKSLERGRCAPGDVWVLPRASSEL